MELVEKSPAPEIECIWIEQTMIDALWDKCAPILQRSVGEDVNFHTLDDIKKEAKEGMWQLWMVVVDGKVVGSFCTNIVLEGSCKLINMFNFAGDNFPLWAENADARMAEFCKQEGALGYQAIARKGFGRFIKALKPIGEIYFRKVGGEQ